MIAQTVPTMTRSEARKHLALSPFFKGHDTTGEKWQTYRTLDGSSVGPDIVQRGGSPTQWNVEQYNGATGSYDRLTDHVSKKEATDLARELAITDYLENHLCCFCASDPCTCDDAPTYTDLPPMGGGAHTAAELNRATSQKRDNERAERNALNEAYHANATTQAQEVAAFLTETGFIISEQCDRDGTPVTFWLSPHAFVKQTPYTIKIYNSVFDYRPSKKGDGELVNRVESGWCQRGEATGYAAGIVAALLPLLETPDPLMQALDAMSDPYANIPAMSGGSQDADLIPDDVTVPGPFGTMSDIQRKHDGHWFDKDTLRFFKSRLPYSEYGVFYGRFFISTEKFDDNTPRLATIRYATDDGHIETVGEFQAYKSPAAAVKALNKLIAAR